MSRQFGAAVPPKTITTMQIYINEKCEEEQRKGSKVSGLGVKSSECVGSSWHIAHKRPFCAIQWLKVELGVSEIY